MSEKRHVIPEAQEIHIERAAVTADRWPNIFQGTRHLTSIDSSFFDFLIKGYTRKKLIPSAVSCLMHTQKRFSFRQIVNLHVLP